MKYTDIKSLASETLITQTKTLCAEERRITAEVLIHLLEIESRRLYAKLGYSSLFEFTVKELKYSEGAAGRRIAAMRMMREVPEIEDQVRSGSLNVTVVSMAKRATQGKSISEKREVLKKLQDQSQRGAETTLAVLYPENMSLREKEKVVSNELTQITLTADSALMEKLTKLKNLLSHKNPNPTYQELLHLMADMLLKKLDPERQLKNSANSSTPSSIAVPIPLPTSPSTPLSSTSLHTPQRTPLTEKHRNMRSRYIPHALKSEIWRKHRGQCSYVDQKSGRKCSSRHLLQIDHIKPFAQAGLTELSNLRLLCRAHNLYVAEKN